MWMAIGIVGTLVAGISVLAFIVSMFKPILVWRGTPTRKAAALQWSILFVLGFVALGVGATNDHARKEAATPVADAPAAVAQAPALPEAPLTVLESLKRSDKVASAKPISVNDRPGIEVVYRDEKALTRSLYVSMLADQIWTAVRDADPADRNAFGGLLIRAEGPIVDGFGHTRVEQLFALVVPGDAIRQFNWASRDGSLLLNYATVHEQTGPGRQLVLAWCESDRVKLFCSTGRL